MNAQDSENKGVLPNAQLEKDVTAAAGSSDTLATPQGLCGTSDSATGVACLESFQVGDLVETPCGHTYCFPHIQQLIETALIDDERFPAGCCNENVMLELVGRALSQDIQNKYKAKQREFETTDRTYCSNPHCAIFIDMNDTTSDRFIRCNICNTMTCRVCKGNEHAGECTKDKDYKETLKTAEAKKWKRCPKCGQVIDRRSGCNDMKV